MSSKKNINPRLALLLILVAVALVALIIFLKTRTGAANGQDGQDSTAVNVAVPDTSLAPDVREVVAPDSTVTSVPDTLSVEADTRPADEAGAEDGYWDGYHDGVAGTEQARYDTSSNYNRPAQRDLYASNYEESYSRGYAEGSRAKE